MNYYAKTLDFHARGFTLLLCNHYIREDVNAIKRALKRNGIEAHAHYTSAGKYARAAIYVLKTHEEQAAQIAREVLSA